MIKPGPHRVLLLLVAAGVSACGHDQQRALRAAALALVEEAPSDRHLYYSPWVGPERDSVRLDQEVADELLGAGLQAWPPVVEATLDTPAALLRFSSTTRSLSGSYEVEGEWFTPRGDSRSYGTEWSLNIRCGFNCKVAKKAVRHVDYR